MSQKQTTYKLNDINTVEMVARYLHAGIDTKRRKILTGKLEAFKIQSFLNNQAGFDILNGIYSTLCFASAMLFGV
jgi:hypothetical protein